MRFYGKLHRKLVEYFFTIAIDDECDDFDEDELDDEGDAFEQGEILSRQDNEISDTRFKKGATSLSAIPPVEPSITVSDTQF